VLIRQAGSLPAESAELADIHSAVANQDALIKVLPFQG
jgi:hypothetical protein